VQGAQLTACETLVLGSRLMRLKSIAEDSADREVVLDDPNFSY